VTLTVGYALYLTEAGDRIAHMVSVLQRFLALFGKSEVPDRDVISLFLIKFVHGASLLGIAV